MDVSDVHLVMRWMLERSGKSRAQVAREMGMSENWLGECFRKRTVPSVLSFVGLAEACGFRVQLVDGDGDVVATLGAGRHVEFVNRGEGMEPSPFRIRRKGVSHGG